MLDKFWESVGENLAGEWFKHVFSPSILFWIFGLIAYVAKIGWNDFVNTASKLSVEKQWFWAIGLLVVLVLSSLVAKKICFSILRYMEGYWEWPFRSLANIIAEWQYWFFEKSEKRWNFLKGKGDVLSRNEYREMSRLEVVLRYYPTSSNEFQPTKLGNILRSSEMSSSNKFGLDAVVVWPRLWLLLPDNARNDLVESRQVMMNLVEIWMWSVLSFIWLIIYPWLLPFQVLWIVFSYNWILDAAIVYSDLLESAFEVYRWDLYNSLHWPLPQKSGDIEIQHGKKVTEYIWRGVVTPAMDYVNDDK